MQNTWLQCKIEACVSREGSADLSFSCSDSSNGPIVVKRQNMPPNSRIDCSNRAESFIEDCESFHEKQENQIEVVSPSSILPPADQKEYKSTETSSNVFDERDDDQFYCS